MVLHMIVSGSSTTLRKLAFCKTKGLDMTKYPSYSSTDLNITKLQPKWIFPLRHQEDVEGFFAQFPLDDVDENDRLSCQIHQFICSGGRPGLLRCRDLSTVVFSVEIGRENNQETTKLLSCLYQCVEACIMVDVADVYKALVFVPFSMVFTKYR